MKQICEIYRKTGKLHHAYGISGDRERVKEDLVNFLINDLKFPITNNPDFWQKEFNVFKVDDGRDLNIKHLNLPIKYDRKVFIIYANSITKEAQNSLLKIFEEPRADTFFFLILPSVNDLLPTLKSRLIFNQKSISSQKDFKSRSRINLNGEEFLECNIGKRLEATAKIIKDIKDEKINKIDAINFLKNIENVIKSNLKLKNSYTAKGKNLLALEDIEKAISYASDESPSIKVILEHLALVL